MTFLVKHWGGAPQAPRPNQEVSRHCGLDRNLKSAKKHPFPTLNLLIFCHMKKIP